jgi:hypothetical protein
MILDLWYPEDVENIILALAVLCFVTYFWNVIKKIILNILPAAPKLFSEGW